MLLGPDGKEEITFEWGLEKKTNNRVEALMLLMGSKIMKERHINSIILIEDSTILIKQMIWKKELKK